MKLFVLNLLSLFLVLNFAACGDEGEGSSDASVNGGENGKECSGHGSLHGDHCHCEAGYESDEQECIEIPKLSHCGEEHEHEEEEEGHDHEGHEHDHAESCLCDPSTAPCDCEEGTEAGEWNGYFYCKADHHHEE